MKALPLISIQEGGFFNNKLNGIVEIVLILVVISSPVFPSPRVAALVKIPFSYLSEIALPSIFNSHINSGFLTALIALLSELINLLTFAYHAANSFTLKALSRLKRGILCSTFLNPLEGIPPNLWEGLSSVIKDGWIFSISINSLYS